MCLQERSGRRLQLGRDISRYKIVRRGQFAMAPMALYYGAIGRFAALEAGITSPAYVVFEAIGSVNPVFLAHLLRSPRMVARYSQLSRGGNKHGKRKVTDFSDLSSLSVALPPRAEQAGIAQLLEHLEVQSDATEELIRKLEIQKQGVMRRMLVGGDRPERELKDLPDRWVFGRVAEGIARIPTDWQLVRLTTVARLESGHTPSRRRPEYWDGDIPWLSMSDSFRMADLTVLESTQSVTELGIANSSARLLPKDTVIMVRTGGSRGACSRLGRPMATSQDYVGYVCGPQLEPRYLEQVFRSLGREWMRVSDGSTSLRSIFMPTFKKMQVLLPSIEEQRRIADVGEAFDLRIAAERAHLDALRELKRGLADALLSGRLRLPPHVIAALVEGAPDVRE
ncbi:MAG: restriction endonuclease subunit S [Alphaproteobacteria bacterium]|nr:restriction endonuclease subunit S [Alphaproteobacteria bacterium]